MSTNQSIGRVDVNMDTHTKRRTERLSVAICH